MKNAAYILCLFVTFSIQSNASTDTQRGTATQTLMLTMWQSTTGWLSQEAPDKLQNAWTFIKKNGQLSIENWDILGISTIAGAIAFYNVSFHAYNASENRNKENKGYFALFKGVRCCLPLTIFMFKTGYCLRGDIKMHSIDFLPLIIAITSWLI